MDPLSNRNFFENANELLGPFGQKHLSSNTAAGRASSLEKTIESFEALTSLKGIRLAEVPLSLFPKKMSLGHYEDLVASTRDFNKLLDNVARDFQFLESSLGNVAEQDPFIAKLLGIARQYELGKSTLLTKDMAFNINRFDYMFDLKSEGFKQVEMNTISCSFMGLSEKSFELYEEFAKSSQVKMDPNISFPKNECCAKSALVLISTHERVKRRLNFCAEPSILMVVNPEEPDLIDHRILVEDIARRSAVNVIKLTLKEINDNCTRLERSNVLIYGDTPISVVYFRSGYSPESHPTEAEWDARLMIELSDCVKCPSVSYQLAGTKKIQQILTKIPILERYIGKKSNSLQKYFMEIRGLDEKDSTESAEAVKDAIKNPHKWLLKPQREGGGHNITNEHLSKILKKAPERQRLTKTDSNKAKRSTFKVPENPLKLPEEIGVSSEARRTVSSDTLDPERTRSCGELLKYILMRKIDSEVSLSVFLKNGKRLLGPTVSEFGFYGAFVRDGEEENNNFLGVLNRTKPSHSVEGGVMRGEGVLDAFTLVRTD